MKIKELLSDESKWTKYSLAKDKDENKVLEDDEKACMWCLFGAIRKIYINVVDRTKIYTKIDEYLFSKGFTFGVVNYNDLESTKFENIKQLLETLDI